MPDLPMGDPDVPLEKWEKLKRLRELKAARDLQRAREAGTRPRPWHTEAREDQLPPDGDWNIWLIMSGRGWGKAGRVLSGSLSRRLGTRTLSGRLLLRLGGTAGRCVSRAGRGC